MSDLRMIRTRLRSTANRLRASEIDTAAKRCAMDEAITDAREAGMRGNDIAALTGYSSQLVSKALRRQSERTA